MNYHGIIIQLMTWAIRISKIHGDYFHKNRIDRSSQITQIFDSALIQSGKTPNFGSNDGTLFLEFSDDDFKV